MRVFFRKHLIKPKDQNPGAFHLVCLLLGRKNQGEYGGRER
jgi:hypothetical protein